MMTSYVSLHIFFQLKSQTASVLNNDVAKDMFQNIEVIHQFHHVNLLPGLRNRLENW